MKSYHFAPHIALTLSRSRGSPLTRKIVWRYTLKCISALSAHSAVKGLIRSSYFEQLTASQCVVYFEM